MHIRLILTLVTVLCGPGILALRCYQCAYPTNTNCLKGVTEFELGTCSVTAEWCYMEVAKEFGRVDVTRGCMHDTPNKTEGVDCVYQPGNVKTICYCSDEACNDRDPGVTEAHAEIAAKINLIAFISALLLVSAINYNLSF
ncbi:uncharacterized protein LOC110858801 [Folsomia candida]|uniref:uncharacterized protein LOC110858801 n=1 Tax=Folsomia candida TaxID=158441 RepID=UPI000B8F8871|nr:uncharacterized protein LOC110858801 [Folsomia candida]